MSLKLNKIKLGVVERMSLTQHNLCLVFSRGHTIPCVVLRNIPSYIFCLGKQILQGRGVDPVSGSGSLAPDL